MRSSDKEPLSGVKIPDLCRVVSGPAGRFFNLETASLSIFGYDHDRSEPAIRLWNDAAHVEDPSALVVGRAGTWKCELEKDGPET